MAEHPAVNRRVVSSSLTCGARFVRKYERSGRRLGRSLFYFLYDSEWKHSPVLSRQGGKPISIQWIPDSPPDMSLPPRVLRSIAQRKSWLPSHIRNSGGDNRGDS